MTWQSPDSNSFDNSHTNSSAVAFCWPSRICLPSYAHGSWPQYCTYKWHGSQRSPRVWKQQLSWVDAELMLSCWVEQLCTACLMLCPELKCAQLHVQITCWYEGHTADWYLGIIALALIAALVSFSSQWPWWYATCAGMPVPSSTTFQASTFVQSHTILLPACTHQTCSSDQSVNFLLV